MKRRLYLKMLITMGLSLSTVSAAQAYWVEPWLPRMTLNVAGGNNSNTEADLLFPLTGNNQSILFADVRAGWEFGSKDQTYSGGLGYRQLLNRQVILGFYGFFDYIHADTGDNFKQVNLGTEALSGTWDFRMNGYIPVGENEKTRVIGGTAAFNQHALTLAETTRTEILMPGIEAEVGRAIPGLPNFKGYGGVYYYGFTKQATAINGGRVRAEYKLNDTVTLTASDQYDRYNGNEVLVGFRLNFGGVSTRDESLENRMEEYIIRSSQRFKKTDTAVTVHDPREFYFVKGEAASGGDGSFEHPFQREEDAVAAAGPGNNVIYTYGGNYHFSGGQLNLFEGQALYGVNEAFVVDGITVLPKGEEETAFYGRINLANNTSLNYFRLDGSQVVRSGSNDELPEPNIGIYGDGLQNVELHGITVENFSGTPGNYGTPGRPATDGGKAYGILLSNSQNVLLDHVTVKNITAGDGGHGLDGDASRPADRGGRGGNAAGVSLENSVGVVINNLTVNTITAGSSVGGNDESTPTPGGFADGGSGGRGGNAVGLDLSGTRNTGVTDSVIANIVAGSSQGGLGHVGGNASFPGSATGVDLSFASEAKVVRSTVIGITAGTARGGNSTSAPGGDGGSAFVVDGGNAFGVRAVNSNGVELDQDVISLVTGGLAQGGQGSLFGGVGQSDHSSGSIPSGFAVGVDLGRSRHSSVTNSVISFLKGGDALGGNVTGMHSVAAGKGGDAGDAVGIRVNGSSSVKLSHNNVSNILGGFSRGGSAEDPTALAGDAGKGGFVVGFDERNATRLTVSDNVFSQLQGGLAPGGAGGRKASMDGAAGLSVDELKK